MRQCDSRFVMVVRHKKYEERVGDTHPDEMPDLTYEWQTPQRDCGGREILPARLVVVSRVVACSDHHIQLLFFLKRCVEVLAFVVVTAAVL